MKIPANFLIVRIRPGGWRTGLLLPLPLFVLEDALEAFALLTRAGLGISRRFGRGRRTTRFSGRIIGITWAAERSDDTDGSARSSDSGIDGLTLLEQFIQAPAAFIRGLRSYGRFVLLEVQDEDTHVSVRLF